MTGPEEGTTVSALANLAQANPGLWLACGGLILGLAFGAVAARTNFCAMGAVSDLVLMGDGRRARAFLCAAATAAVGTQALAGLGLVEPGRSIYLARELNWVGHTTGGLLFGVGMVLAGGCVSRNLVRAGGGDLRALATIIAVGLVAYMAAIGPLSEPRAAIAQALQLELPGRTQGIDALLMVALGLTKGSAALLATLLLAGAVLAFCRGDPNFRASSRHIAAGVGVGLVVAVGWAVTGLAHDELAVRVQPAGSLTFVRPTADTLGWLVRLSGAPAPGFGVASVIGTLAGAFLAARASGRFRLQGFADRGDLLRCLGGAALMGLGGVLALGCTIGQGITGVASLAVGSLLTLVSLVTGGVFGVFLLQQWHAPDA
jgi:hypothetical protein